MDIKGLVLDMHDIVAETCNTLDSLYTGFIYNNVKVVDEAILSLEESIRRVEPIMSNIGDAVKENRQSAPYLGVPSHIGRITDSMSRIAESVKTKIKEDVLFSDKAVTELDYIFERTRDIMIHTKDLILARNTLASKHIQESQKALEMTANHYATMHEERLIEGLCLPKAGALYIDMLDSFKTAAWHAREIAKELGG